MIPCVVLGACLIANLPALCNLRPLGNIWLAWGQPIIFLSWPIPKSRLTVTCLLPAVAQQPWRCDTCVQPATFVGLGAVFGPIDPALLKITLMRYCYFFFSFWIFKLIALKVLCKKNPCCVFSKSCSFQVSYATLLCIVSSECHWKHCRIRK